MAGSGDSVTGLPGLGGGPVVLDGMRVLRLCSVFEPAALSERALLAAPLAWAAARRHRCPLVVTVHASVRHNMRVTSARTAWLRLAGGPAERRALTAADMVIVLTRPAADRLMRDGIPEPRIGVIPPGYDPDLIATAVDAPDPFPDLAGRGSATSAGSPRRRTSAR